MTELQCGLLGFIIGVITGGALTVTLLSGMVIDFAKMFVFFTGGNKK